MGVHQTLTRVVAIAAGVALLVLGCSGPGAPSSPNAAPTLLDPSPDRRLEVSASAIADALRADAEAITGVNRARARMVGTTATPVLSSVELSAG